MEDDFEKIITEAILSMQKNLLVISEHQRVNFQLLQQRTDEIKSLLVELIRYIKA